MKFCRLSRRHFLQGVGGATLALPFLSSLLPREVAAEVPLGGKFFIHLATEHGGLNPLDWCPDLSSYQWQSSEQQLLYSGSVMEGTLHYMRRKPLAELVSNGRLSSVFSAEFTPLLPKMNIIDGLALMFGGSHHTGGYLGNFHGNMNRDYRTGVDSNLIYVPPVPTVDQILARSTQFYSESDPRTIPLLNVNGPGATQSFRNFNGSIQPTAHSWNLQSIFNMMFGDSNGSQSSPERLQLINRVYEDYRRLMSPASIGARMSTDDAQVVENHLESLAQMERRLRNIGEAASCTAIGVSGTRYGRTDPQSNASLHNPPNRDVFASHWSTYVDLMVTAINCGLCRVFTVPIGAPHAYSGDYHQQVAHMRHTDPAQAIIRDAHQFVARFFVLPLLQRLNDMPTTNGGRLLDNGLVCWQHESWHATHEGLSIPTMLAGGAAGALRTGYYIDFRNLTNRALQRGAYLGGGQGFNQNHVYSRLYPGLPMNRWLHTLMHAMGVDRNEYLRIAGVSGSTMLYGYGDHTIQSGANAFTFDHTIGGATQRVTHESFPQRVLSDCNTPLPFLAV